MIGIRHSRVRMRGQEDDHVVSTLRDKRASKCTCWAVLSSAACRPSRMTLEERESKSLFGVNRLNLFPYQAKTITILRNINMIQ